jgi:asparagine synthase (glutamine-hydrolysing)
MNFVTDSDPFAVTPYYYVPDSAIHGSSIASIIRTNGFRGLNKEGIHQYLEKKPDGILTCINSINKLPPNHQLRLESDKLTVHRKPDEQSCTSTLPSLLTQALQTTTTKYSRCALALSGGLDSALVLGLLRESSIPNIEVYTLATGMTDYCELELTKRTAAYYGVKLNIVWATGNDFVEALPDAIRSSETPLFNLHPVSKLLLARRMAADGIDCIITGDAADQVFSGVDAKNYLPIVGAIVKNEGLAYASPFFEPKIVHYGKTQIDENKSALRNICHSLVPEFVQVQKKKSRYAPSLDINRYWDSTCINWISKDISMPIDISSYAKKSLWITLGILINSMRGNH